MAVSDESIISGLLQNGTIKSVSEATGLSVRAIHDRMKKTDFRIEYTEAKNDIIRMAILSINGKLSEAVNTVSEIMSDKSNNPAIRLQAAQTIMNNATRLADKLASDEGGSLIIGKSYMDDLDDLDYVIKGSNRRG